MKKRQYTRYKEPVFSRKFTAFFLMLAVAAAGFAIYVVIFADIWATDFGPAEIIPPSNGYIGYEYVPNESEPAENQRLEDDETPEDNAQEEIIDSATPTSAPQESSETPTENYENHNYYEYHQENLPYVPYTPFTLLTMVDNTQLPWYLKLVNRYNFLDYYFHPQLNPIGNGHYFDARAYRSLLDMLDSARAEGLSPIVASSFRSVSRQTTLFNNRIQRFVDIGYSEEDAFEQARRIVAYPGTSEHNLGLAVDIVALSYQNLTANQANTPEGIWLAENSYRYGFVLRYPYDKQHITNIIFEPWHFRYVGRAAAAEMFERGLVLEEFVSERLAGVV
ncbi:MAG: M15 family metallopeptidase [Defluviitaleaceae bacterium]|nr:M15 family metallopeptidase [Defluviitaleaceae bacterium]